MNDHFGMPGPGGSLGQCAFCGKTFFGAILGVDEFRQIEINGCCETLYAHLGCIKKFKGKQFYDLPPESPLRQAWEKAKQ